MAISICINQQEYLMPSALTAESENLRTHWFKTKGLDWSSLLNQCAEGLPSL